MDWSITHGAGGVYGWLITRNNAGGLYWVTALANAAQAWNSCSGGYDVIQFEGQVYGAAAATFKLQAAQHVAEVSDLTILKGSTFEYVDIT